MTSRRFSVTEPAPADAETYGQLRIVRYVGSLDRPAVKVWRGRQQRPGEVYVFASPEERETWIANRKRRDDAERQAKAERSAADKARREAMRRQLEVGTILVASWGYEQTNVDFYQVVELRGADVIIRPIASRTTETGHMSGKAEPVAGSFTGEPMRKRIGAFGVSVDHTTASPVEPGRSYYASWYH